MTRKRFEKLLRAAMTRCHELNKAAGGPLSYIPGKAVSGRCYTRPDCYEDAWAVIDGVLPVKVGK